MTFFERYFAALDGPDPHSSLELVSEDVEFAIQWASRRRTARALRSWAESAELRAFIDAATWATGPTTCSIRREDGQIAFALGETRYDDSGERIGTFLAVAELDAEGRMRKYLVARTQAIDFGLDRRPISV